MPGFIQGYIELIQSTPTEQIGDVIFIALAPFLIVCVVVWGFIELWLNHRRDRFVDEMQWTTLQIFVPQDSIQTPKGIENFFTTLSGTRSGATFIEKWFDGKIQAWHSFEIISDEGRIGFFIHTQKKYRDYIEAAFYAQYPDAQITEVEDYAEKVPTDFPNDDFQMWGGEVTLKKDDFLPIRTWEEFEHQGEKDNKFKDPLFNMLEVLGSMQVGEHYYIQMIISTPDDQKWTEKGKKFIDKVFGKPEPKKKKGFINENIGWLPAGVLEQSVGLVLGGDGEAPKEDDFRAFKITPFEKEQIDAVTKKVGKYGFLTKIRFLYWAKSENFQKGKGASMSKGLFGQYTDQKLNGLGFIGSTIPEDDYPWQRWAEPGKIAALARRYKKRSFGEGGTPKIMNTEELATFWHFPAADARTPVLTAVGGKRSEAPIELGFAPDTAPILQNMDRSPEDGVGPAASGKLPEKKPLSVPDIGQQYKREQDQVDAPTAPEAPKSEDVMVSVPLEPAVDLSKPQIAVSFRDSVPASQAITQAAPQATPVSAPQVAPPTASSPEQIPAESQPQEASVPAQPPTLPTMLEEESRYMPKPGMPAPLPPGLDIADQPLPPDFYEKSK